MTTGLGRWAVDPQRHLIWRSSELDMVGTVDRHRSLTVVLAAAILLLAGCASSTPAASGPLPTATSAATTPGAGAGGITQTSAGGQVTVVVDWTGPAAGAVFDVKLDTHSVDLDALDLSNAILRNDRGETMSANPWAAPKGGHHREGALTFAGDATEFLAGASWVELVLSGVGDLAERTLRWKIDA